MRGNRISRILKFVLFGVIALTVFGFVVMGLWNWLMPNLFGLKVITFWQGIGLLLLSKILFGGFRGGPGAGMHWRRRIIERWEQMTPEERAKFREGMRHGCGPFGRSASPPTAEETSPI